MTTGPQSLIDSLRSRRGLADICSAGIGATSPGSKHSQIPLWSKDNLAEVFVEHRIAEGIDIPEPGQEANNALATTAHSHGLHSIAHAISTASYYISQEGKVDTITHAPLEAIPSKEFITQMVTKNHTVIPTLTMMERITARVRGPDRNYKQACASGAAFYEASIPILAGTDAKFMPGAPSPVLHGESLYRELELLIEAGMGTVDVFRATTSFLAKYFGVSDRGVVAQGMKAGLVLLGGKSAYRYQGYDVI